jgi:3-oxoacyl-[acyl-carrier protein] reductase
MMDLNLNGHTALVTAATSGIGLATSTLLPQMGATVWLNGRSDGRLSRQPTWDRSRPMSPLPPVSHI